MKGNKDPEYIELRNKFLLGFSIVAIFAVAIILLFVNKFGFGTTIDKKINKNETFVVFVTQDKCNNCDKVKEILNNRNVEYEELTYGSNDTDRFYEKYSVTKTEAPSVIYIRKGKIYSSMFTITNFEELELFLENYKLIK